MAFVLATHAGERPQPRVDRGEVAIRDDGAREQPVLVHAAELVEVASAGERRPAIALREIPVAGIAPPFDR